MLTVSARRAIIFLALFRHEAIHIAPYNIIRRIWRMTTQLARNWWILLLRGLAALLFGVLAILSPLITATVLVIFFGAYALVDGIFAVYASLTHRAGHDRWWVLLLEGLTGIVIGLLAYVYPDVATLFLLYFIAAWAILTGIMEIVAAIRLRREIEGEWLLVFSGILSVLFGILVVIFPVFGTVAVVWLIGIYAILFGLLLITLGLRVRGWGSPNDRVAPRMA
jgi:uncharacterized membrane protein HdeD (DUF308 family)